MIRRLVSLLRGVWLLRHPELVRRLGDLRLAVLEHEELRARHPGARIDPGAIVQGWREGDLSLAPESAVEVGSILALGDHLNGYGKLVIGPRTWVGPYNNLRLSGGAEIRIGADCLISQFCTLVGANHRLERGQSMRHSPCDLTRTGVTLEDDVWLGAGVAVLPGVTIGRGAVLGANSVVTHSVPAYEIWAGVPARKIGERPA